MLHHNQPTCIFCKIVLGQLPSRLIVQNDTIVVFQDIAPKAPIHYLIVPRTHIRDVMALDATHTDIVRDMFLMARQLGATLGGEPAFRLVLNNGQAAGQTVFHLHMHFLSGTNIPSMTSDEL